MNFDVYRRRRVLITGGLGFIGSNIAQKLVHYGAQITIVDSLAPLYGGNLVNVAEICDKITLFIGDYRDQSLMKSLIGDTDVIFHLAAQVSYIDIDLQKMIWNFAQPKSPIFKRLEILKANGNIYSSRIPFDDLDLNCRGTLQLLEMCRKLNPEARVVFASSRLVLGRIVSQPIQENHSTEPLSLYGVHKLTCEKYHQLYAAMYGLKTAVLRITNPYGERQQLKHSKYSLPGWFMRLVLEGKPIKIFGNGGQLRDYIYATDLADAFLVVGISDIPSGEIFNCGFGQSVPFREMAEMIVRVLKKGTIEFVPWPSDYEKVETGDVNFDIGKLRRMTGWTPTVSMEEGIKRMYQYFATRLPLYL